MNRACTPSSLSGRRTPQHCAAWVCRHRIQLGLASALPMSSVMHQTLSMLFLHCIDNLTFAVSATQPKAIFVCTAVSSAYKRHVHKRAGFVQTFWVTWIMGFKELHNQVVQYGTEVGWLRRSINHPNALPATFTVLYRSMHVHTSDEHKSAASLAPLHNPSTIHTCAQDHTYSTLCT
jgi:hypothetical protein